MTDILTYYQERRERRIQTLLLMGSILGLAIIAQHTLMKPVRP